MLIGFFKDHLLFALILPLIIYVVSFFIKNNGIISIFYQIKLEKKDNLSKLIKSIEELDNKNPTMGTQNNFRVALRITPTFPEIKFIAEHIKDVRDLLHLKRLYSRVRFDEGKNIFLINKSAISEWMFDAAFSLFSGFSIFLFVLFLASVKNIHEMILPSMVLLVISLFIAYSCLIMSGMAFSRKELLKKNIIQEQKDKNISSWSIWFNVCYLFWIGIFVGIFALMAYLARLPEVLVTIKSALRLHLTMRFCNRCSLMLPAKRNA